MPSRPPIPRGIDATASRPDDRSNAIPREQNVSNLNRPLPPTPLPSSSLPMSYEIPTLRQKPAPDPPSDSTSRHSRSHSHPFPSFFGSKKASKKPSEKLAGGTTDPVEKVDDNTQGKQPNGQTIKGNGTPVTGKCMTCASTVRWPSELKVFRCTTCLTINDLEPCEGPLGTDGGYRRGPIRKLAPLSLERTKKLIDYCLREYLQRQLEPDSVDADLERSQPEAILASEEEFEDFRGVRRVGSIAANARRPRFQDRSPSDSRLLGIKASLRMEQIAHPNNEPQFLQPHQTPQEILDYTKTAPHAVGTTIVPVRNIFRSLESYISGYCHGCTGLNISFFSNKPAPHRDQRSMRSGHPRQQVSEAQTTPTAEPDVFLSELDAKMLLLGDVAENGSWWTNSKSLREEDTTAEPLREHSPERTRGAVGAKTPRVNWPEVTEWYRLILHAGEEWRSHWSSLRPNEDSPLYPRWESISEEKIGSDVIESRVHLHRCLMKATENLLKRPRRPLKTPEDCRFLLIILANPLLNGSFADETARNAPKQTATPTFQSSIHSSPTKIRSNSFTPKKTNNFGQHSGIIKRILGLLSSLSNEIHLYLVSWFSRLGDFQFQRLVEIIGSFVTYRLTRQLNKPVQEVIDPTEGLIPNFATDGLRHASQLHAALGGRSNSTAKKQETGPKVTIYSEDWQIRAAARVMALLFQANGGHNSRKQDISITKEQRLRSAGMNAMHQAHVHGQITPISNFYNSMLDHADLIADFETWETTKSKFTFCQYPFFLSIWAKIHVLEHDARRQMETKAREAFFDSILSRKAVSQFLVLKVRRDCLVEDSLRSVSEVIGKGGSDIKKGLRIDFAGEEGVDAGGLRKEWFLLLVREIFNPHHGLFVYDEDSQFCYFNPFCFESSEQFFLVGVLLGLAIYNSTILDVAFPPFVFKKMLASSPLNSNILSSIPRVTHSYSLDDLAELHPTLARGLRQLLEYEGDVQETFCRDFVVEMDRYGEKTRFLLCPGGDRRPVTNSNRREFVDLYVRYLLDTSVSRQYEPFKRGFFTVCGGNAMSLFRPEEIELLVRGSDEPLDVGSLRAVASYDNWPKDKAPEDQPQVSWFWEFFEGLSPLDQRKLLSFITGSDRIPAMGATNLIIRIQLLFDKDANETGGEIQRFPIARTCFNLLGIYAYGSRELLERKLWWAVTESEGFGLK